MVSKVAIINNPTGLHARPATDLINFIKKFESKVFLQNGNKKANAASIINLLTLGAKQGTALEVICEGADEAQAAAEVAAFIEAIAD